MAARNSDSKKIFDYYVNRLLSEQEANASESDETSSDSQKKPQTGTSSSSEQSPKTATPYMPNPGLQSGPGMQGGDARREQYVDAYGGGKPIKTWNQQNAASYPPGPLANPTPEQKSQMQGGEEEKVAPSTAPKTADDKEKGLLKQLHASDFNPNSTTDQKRLEELRTAQTKLKEKLGREPSLQELAAVSYAQQYGEKSPYYAQAQKLGIDLKGPGQMQNQGGQAVVQNSNQPQASTPVDQNANQGNAQSGDLSDESVWGQNAQQAIQSVDRFRDYVSKLTPQQKAWFKKHFVPALES